MTKYVCGFLFNKSMSQVALIKKNRPDWQKGKLNGIGGRIEPGESIWTAMQREFMEETGVDHSYWKHFLTLTPEQWCVYFFYGVTDTLNDLESKTDEEVVVIRVDDVRDYHTISNVPWLIDIALYQIKYPEELIYVSNSHPELQELIQPINALQS